MRNPTLDEMHVIANIPEDHWIPSEAVDGAELAVCRELDLVLYRVGEALIVEDRIVYIDSHWTGTINWLRELRDWVKRVRQV